MGRRLGRRRWRLRRFHRHCVCEGLLWGRGWRGCGTSSGSGAHSTLRSRRMSRRLTDQSPLPPPIAEVLLLAQRQTDRSSELAERLGKVEKYLIAAFAEPANKQPKLGKAMQWLARCLAYARSTPAVTLPAVPYLDQLWKLVEGEIREGSMPLEVSV